MPHINHMTTSDDNERFHHSHYTEDGMYMYGDTCFEKVVEQGLDVLQQILGMKDEVGLPSSAVHIVDSQVVNVRDYKGIEILEIKWCYLIILQSIIKLELKKILG